VPSLATFDVYDMRMARVNITVPDDVIAEARAAGLNVSRVATVALVDELDRLAKIHALDAYLAELDAELGPPTAEEINEAHRWADQILTPSTAPAPRRRRSA
jgi:post-segregation antitoxin (ccd killing protein)